MDETSIFKEIAKHLGIKVGLCRNFIRVVRDCVIKELRNSGECVIPGVGVFRVKTGHRTRVTFKVSPKLLSVINKGPTDNTGLYDEVIQDLSELVDQRTNQLFSETLGSPQTNKSVSRNFIYYLKNRYPLGQDWAAPNTGREYSLRQVQRALEVYQQVEPEGYFLLWSLWVSMEARDNFIRKSRTSPEELIIRWYKAVDSVLFILFNPELVPARVRETPIKRKVEPDTTDRHKKKLDYYLAPFIDN